MLSEAGRLIVVCTNPPEGPGHRTIARCELARSVLEASSVFITNIFAHPTASVSEIADVGANESGWLAAREGLSDALGRADTVLLAYGMTAPGGTAAGHHRRQVAWLTEQISRHLVKTIEVGNGPRHPSRWQRWTARAHPELSFPDALAMSMRPAQGHGNTITCRSHGRSLAAR